MAAFERAVANLWQHCLRGRAIVAQEQGHSLLRLQRDAPPKRLCCCPACGHLWPAAPRWAPTNALQTQQQQVSSAPAAALQSQQQNQHTPSVPAVAQQPQHQQQQQVSLATMAAPQSQSKQQQKLDPVAQSGSLQPRQQERSKTAMNMGAPKSVRTVTPDRGRGRRRETAINDRDICRMRSLSAARHIPSGPNGSASPDSPGSSTTRPTVPQANAPLDPVTQGDPQSTSTVELPTQDTLVGDTPQKTAINMGAPKAVRAVTP